MKSRILLVAACVGALLVACTKVSGPFQLYLIGSSRFTSGSKTGLGPADTLATRLYVVADSAGGLGVQEVKATVTYSPTRQPFVYPYPITAFLYTNLPTGETITYLDTLLAAPYPKNFLFTSVFGIRTTTGTERWEYEAYDAGSHTTTRAFVLATRRSDSVLVYNDYTLRLNVPARGGSFRRFLELKSGLALPAYTVLGRAATPNGGQQSQIDLVQSVDGLRLFAPDTLGKVVTFSEARWPSNQRRATRFRLTSLTATGFASQTDTLSIRQQYVPPGRASLTSLVAGQVYAFRTYPLNGEKSTFGLLLVKSVPGGTTAGLQLEIRTAKQPL